MSKGLPAGTALQGSELVSHVRNEIGGWLDQVAGALVKYSATGMNSLKTEQASAETEELKSRALGADEVGGRREETLS